MISINYILGNVGLFEGVKLHRVLQLIAEGRLSELTLETLQEEILGLREDLLNFELGHGICEVKETALTAVNKAVDTVSALKANLLIATQIRAKSRNSILASRKLREELHSS